MPEETQEQTDQPQTETQPDEAAEPVEAEAEEAEKGPPNKVDVEDAGVLKKKVTVTILRERIDGKFDEMFGELSTTAQVPGFRIGRAPRRLIEKRFGREVSQDVRNALIGESIGDAIDKSKLKTLGQPDIDLDEIELPDSGDMAFSFEVEVAPEFDLPELKGVKIDKPAAEITDDRIDEYVEQLRLSRARLEDTDAAAAEGDTVVGGAKISGDGIETVERHGLTLRVAPGQIEGLPLVDLGKALAGKKAGESAAIKITVPEAHPNEDWRGKEVTVDVTVSQVRKRILPDLNDEFASGMGFESLKEMRKYVSSQMESRLVVETQRNMHEQICRYLLDNTQFDLPEGVVNRHTASVLQRRYVDLLYRGMSREQIDERLTELQAAATEQAEQDLKLSFILGKIAEGENIEVTEDEVNSRIARMATANNRRPERLRQELAQDGSLEQVADSLREEKALDKLLEQAKITEAAKTTDEKETKEKKTAKKTQKKTVKKAAKKKTDKEKSSGA